ncbi:unnamed protein product [Leptosia nina]|uniref:Uncharacterized protein n=1 Tax=Leptosia nina TaxID=320188 RepID=A0AAV1IXB8_9NEOP
MPRSTRSSGVCTVASTAKSSRYLPNHFGATFSGESDKYLAKRIQISEIVDKLSSPSSLTTRENDSEIVPTARTATTAARREALIPAPQGSMLRGSRNSGVSYELRRSRRDAAEMLVLLVTQLGPLYLFIRVCVRPDEDANAMRAS